MEEKNEKVYYLVITYIKELAETGQIEFGSKIPSERELMVTPVSYTHLEAPNPVW